MMLYAELTFLLTFTSNKDHKIYETYHYTPKLLYKNYMIIFDFIDKLEKTNQRKGKLTSSQSQY
jgi:hypothetical protein